MTSCIVTIIKNEHLYLDEWIKYHLSIGVSHFFIYEDIDSDSHKEITDKYGDCISLANISSLFNNEELEYIKHLKRTRKDDPQHIYFRKALTYIKENFNYDWCFEIDLDEFITLENKNDKLADILNLYNNYDAVLIQWLCYNANGLLKRPDYSKQGVVDYFTTPVSNFKIGPHPDSWSKKMIYNLHNYKPEFWVCVHQPSDDCNFCNTLFERNRQAIVYNKIFLRHYITKSWEEYVWKKQSRGYFMGFSSTYETFFKLNPDFESIREELLLKTKDEILVVLPYSQGSSQGNELRLALTSWKKFCQFKYKFIVIGDFNRELPKEFRWVTFIQQERKQKVDNQYNPHLDIVSKMYTIYEKLGCLYPGFIYTCDDFYAIKPFTLEDITTIYYHQSSFTGVKNLPTSFWKHDKWKTRQLLDRENLPHINYTAHYPCYFFFKQLITLCNKYNMRDESYVIEDIYYNSYRHKEPILDSTIRLGIWSKEIFDKDFQKAVEDPNIKFVCNSVEGWSKELEEALWKIVV